MPSTAVGYSAIPMSKDEVVLAVSSDHPFADQLSNTIDQLRDQNIIEREGDSGTWQTVVQSLSAAGIELPEHRVSMTLGSTQAVMADVDQNLGVGFVAKHAVENHDRVVALRIEGLALERDLNLIYESARVHGRHTPGVHRLHRKQMFLVFLFAAFTGL